MPPATACGGAEADAGAEFDLVAVQHPTAQGSPPAPGRAGGNVDVRPGGGPGAVIALAVLWVALAAGALAPGLEYYLTPLQERAFSEGHERFAPTGVVGHSLGIGGSLLMAVGVASYSLRKRVPALARVGRLRSWLRFHIFLCTLGPYLVLLHTSFKFGGLVSIAFWSMALVVASGLFGRYVYVRIPKTVNGQFHPLRQIRRRRDELAAAVREAAGVGGRELETLLEAGRTPPPGGLAGAVWAALRFDAGRRRRLARLRRILEVRGVPAGEREALAALIQEEAALEHQLALLAPFQRLFRYWHVFHLPLAILMFAILIVHVVVAVLFGYGWPF